MAEGHSPTGLQVLDRTLDHIDAIPELTETAIAGLAQDPADLSGLVVVIDVHRRILAAASAEAILGLDHRRDFVGSYPEPLFEVVMTRVPVKSSDRLTSSRVVA